MVETEANSHREVLAALELALLDVEIPGFDLEFLGTIDVVALDGPLRGEEAGVAGPFLRLEFGHLEGWVADGQHLPRGAANTINLDDDVGADGKRCLGIWVGDGVEMFGPEAVR